MTFGESFKHNLVKPFEGRASRSEYWWFFLWYILIIIAIFVVFGLMFGGIAAIGSDPDQLASSFAGSIGIVGILIIFPLYGLLLWMALAGFCAAGRRMHDLNKSAWWLLLGMIPYIGWLILLVMFCLKGTQGTNRFGADPNAQSDAAVFE